MTGRVERPDHIEVLVPDRADAAAWYSRVLGLTPVGAAARWADNPEGPLMLSSDGTARQVMLALFAGEPQGPHPQRGFRRLAFRTTAAGFESFVADAPRLGLTVGGAPLQVFDHGEAFSVYFQDPYGNHLEVTTYEHQALRAARGSR